MNGQRIRDLRQTYRRGLLDDTLPFWIEHGVDDQQGGFFTCLDRDGTVIDTDKAVWQQGRFTWLLAALYNRLEPRAEWLRLARHGGEFLDQHGVDPADGRMWFQLTREGRPIRKRRYAFSECFAAIAYGELARATRSHTRESDKYARQAKQRFDAFVQHTTDPPPRDAKFSDVRPVRSIAVPMMTIVTASELRDSIDLPEAERWIDHGIEQICRFHLKPEIGCVMETVGQDGEQIDHFDGRTLNPGHAIEAAWFILWEARRRQSREWVETGCRMLDWMWQRGWDSTYGGILYFVSVDRHPISEYWHDMKFWWPQCETIIATLLAYQLTGDPKYADRHRQVHDWAYQHFPDPLHGEWFGYLHRNGSLSSPLKGNLWKGPFHLPRMQWICSDLLKSLGTV